MMKKVFITSVTGAQGQGITSVFKRAGYDIVGIARNHTNIDGVTLHTGSMEDLTVLTQAVKGSEAIILTLPLQFDSDLIKLMTSNIVKAAKENGISKIIFNTSIALGKEKTGYASIDVKHDALEILDGSGLDVITVMPTLYLGNLSSPFLLPVIKEHSIVPYPIAGDFSFSWISYENLGRYILAALNEKTLIGERVLVTNRDETTGGELVAKIADATGKQLTFVPTSAEEFENNLQPVLGDYVAKEVSNLYRGIDSNRQDFKNYTHEAFLNSVELESTEDWIASVSW